MAEPKTNSTPAKRVVERPPRGQPIVLDDAPSQQLILDMVDTIVKETEEEAT